ncbi:MAG: ATP phosphoribosyltransferase regulatory subunit [Gallionellales bacterium GWA2_60_142]|jgi:ATP phosphoribosyltransferase regulatory subunit|nr:MAG: ATP phosphoribosyltransferase regulatory subunit [Gallionellales bacterium GWA2_60_142]HCI14002.1 ATP phosphoribosyltransferase regulatory subunit [Gallionellaceae bacterium]
MPNWLLPEYIQDMLPEEAWRVETMRAQFLELMRTHGYQLVAPPLLEYAESLLIDGSADMDLRTFKLVDQLSGRTLALRADITPQVARIDAHLLNRQGVARLCYAGSVLHTQPAGLTRTRELLQIGAELYGHSGLESDLEIQRLMLQALALLGVENVHLDLGHVGVFRALVRHAGLDRELENALFAALQSKDSATLRTLAQPLDAEVRDALLALPVLYGDCADVLARARRVLPNHPDIAAALNDLDIVSAKLTPLVAKVGIDLADLRGYHYHSGMVFAAYHAGSHDAIALGGRYDDLGKSFGRARAATGFSMDLRQLYRLLSAQLPKQGICAPALDDAALCDKIVQLRAAGEAVVVDLLGDAALRGELQCDRELVSRDGKWQVVAL